MTKQIKDMTEDEVIDHYTTWFFDSSLKDEFDLKIILKKIIKWEREKRK